MLPTADVRVAGGRQTRQQLSDFGIARHEELLRYRSLVPSEYDQPCIFTIRFNHESGAIEKEVAQQDEDGMHQSMSAPISHFPMFTICSVRSGRSKYVLLQRRAFDVLTSTFVRRNASSVP